LQKSPFRAVSSPFSHPFWYALGTAFQRYFNDTSTIFQRCSIVEVLLKYRYNILDNMALNPPAALARHATLLARRRPKLPANEIIYFAVPYKMRIFAPKLLHIG
jgi:hypothetical protein